MALSNWDTLAVDLTGKPCGGAFTSPDNVSVEIYKNWLYLHDPKAWVEGRGFAEPVIMQVEQGDLTYADVHIVAIRGPQQGVYCAVWSHPLQEGGAGGRGERDWRKYLGMVGCGVYGFGGKPGNEWIGVSNESLSYLRRFLNTSDPILTREEAEHEVDRTVSVYDSGDEVGKPVTGEDREIHVRYAMERAYILPDEVRKGVPLDDAVRFNQGDAFLSSGIGLPLHATPPGQATTPYIMGMIKQMKKQQE